VRNVHAHWTNSLSKVGTLITQQSRGSPLASRGFRYSVRIATEPDIVTMCGTRLEHPLTGSKTWVEFDGTFVARKVWDGRANVEEVELNSPTGPIEGLTLRLYNPQSRQWSIYWANSKNGAMGTSPQIGQFKNGRGEFYGTDTLNGKLIYVRFVWTNTNTPHFEQSYSDDGGKTWDVNWMTEQTRISDASDKPR
jgi:hypothetical protein